MTDSRPAVSHFLLAVDADGIQSYVYESSRLPEIRGGSGLLQRRDKEAPDVVRAHAGNLCCCAGGSLTAAFASRCAAEECGRDLARRFVDATMVATATWAVVDCAADPEQDQSAFQEARRRAAEQLRRKKLARTQVPFFEAPPYARRCQSCDVRPASDWVTDQAPNDAGVPERRAICEPCHRKRRAGGAGSSGGPRKLEELDNGRPVGMILLDGDGIGSLLETMDWGTLRDFSSELSQAVDQSLAEALQQVPAERRDRYQLIYAGGDDLLVFVPGADALEVALDTIGAFRKRMGARCSLSGGVVIAHPHYPVHFLHRLVKDLLKSAKAERRAAGGQTEGWLDFEILRSASAEAGDLAGLRRAREATEGNSLRQTHDRPYSAAQMRGLLNTAKQLKKDHLKGQITMIAEAQRQGMLQGAAFAMYQMAREEKLRAGWDLALRSAYDTPFGWRKRTPGDAAHVAVYSSCLPDIADIYDFV